MGFAPLTTSLFNNVNTGEAPQLSSTYAEYDDGANIFNFYDNFAGTVLNTSKWNILTNENYSVDNKLIVYPGSFNAESKSTVTDGLLLLYVEFQTNSTSPRGGGQSEFTGFINMTGSLFVFLSWSPYMQSQTAFTSFCVTSCDHPIQPASIRNLPELLQVIYTSNSVTTEIDYNSPVSVAYPVASSQTANIYIDAQPQTSTNVIYNYMAYVYYPPNGVMPSVAFDSIS
jgi:hypothetical protein